MWVICQCECLVHGCRSCGWEHWLQDFSSLRVLGKGAFGVVHLVQRQGTEEVYALKQIQKAHYVNKNRMKAWQDPWFASPVPLLLGAEARPTTSEMPWRVDADYGLWISYARSKIRSTSTLSWSLFKVGLAVCCSAVSSRELSLMKEGTSLLTWKRRTSCPWLKPAFTWRSSSVQSTPSTSVVSFTAPELASSKRHAYQWYLAGGSFVRLR